ncbi:uncharacterized protein LOC110461970 isoform X2 [Mizuhopecten yessoensis]|uniref:uncharacterized protein LOC110461970 isoform X2 n=1 Tax=Mizuhopecten yessoensis TaxID=6573 RepID=UPI000B45908D|nr:uncharacterized protein LOC110461970 isoform X2 [Mizuhopecten yessoensis]
MCSYSRSWCRSFGHHHAKEYQVNAGLRGTIEEVKRRRHGVCLTRLSVTKLNHMVVRSLVDKGINAIGLPAAGSWLMDNGQVSRHGVTSIVELLDSCFVPVLHGDCVLDSSKGCIILSGDVIIKTICKEQKVNRVVFLSDVFGVYDKPPSQTDAEHISKICVSQDRRIMTDISTSESQYDVTGGMMLKIQTAMDIVINSGGTTKVYITKVGSNCVNQICEGLDTGQDDTKSFTQIIHHQ